MSSSDYISKKCSTIAEVGSDRIKLVQVTRNRDGATISKILLRKYDAADDKVIPALAADIQKLGLTRSPVIACLPRQVVNVRLLEMPSTDPVEIASMVELQVGKQTPYARDEIVADHRIIGRGREGYTRVLLIMVQQSVMRQRFRILEEAGLEVESMTVSSEGLINWYRSILGTPGGEGGTVLLDVDAGYSELAIVSRSQLVFTKSILVGSRQLLDDPARWIEKMCQEVENAIDIYRGEAGGNVVLGACLLSGAAVHIGGLDGALGNRLKLIVHPVDYMEKIKKVAGLPDTKGDDYREVSFTPLVGMAIAPEALEFSLVPESVKARRDLERKARNLTTLGSLSFLTAAFLSLMAIVMIHHKLEYLFKLRAKILETEKPAAEILKQKQTIVTVMERLNSTRSPVSILYELYKLTPPSVMYDSIVFDSERSLVLKGQANSFPDVDKLKGTLEGSMVIFPNVTCPKQTKDARTGLIVFELNCSAPGREE